MIKVNKGKKTANKLTEFLAIFTLTFGLMIGSGLYLKNSNKPGGVLDVSDGNPMLAIFMWVAIGVIASMMMLIFIEGFSSFKPGEPSAIQSLAKKFINRKVGSFLSIYYIVVYIPIMVSIGGLFTVSVLFEGIDSFNRVAGNKPLDPTITKPIEIVVGLLLLFGFSALNGLTKKPAKIIQISVTFLKFFPILVVIIAGFILGAKGQEPNAFDNYKNSEKELQIGIVLSTAVPIMFAFNGFADGAAIQKDIEHKSVIAPGLLVGMLVTTLFYVIVSVAIFLGSENGNMFDLFEKAFKNHSWLVLLLRLVIAITVISLLNGYTASSGPSFKASFDEKLLASEKWKDKEMSHFKSSLYQFVITLSLLIVYITISLLVNINADKSDSANYLNYFYVTNLMSDLIAVAAFSIYLTIMISIIVNRFTKKVEVRKVRGGLVFGIIGASLLTFLVAYLYVDLFILKFLAASGWNIKNNTWGPALTGRKLSDKIVLPIIFIVLALIISVLYFLNEKRLKKINYVWEKNKNKNIIKK